MANTYVALEGGLDLEVPPLESKPGSCLEALNVFESVKGGYRSIAGFERYDGQPSPALASFYRYKFTNADLAGDPTLTDVGQTLVISTLTGIVLHKTYSLDNTEMVLIVGEVTGEDPLSTDFPIAFDGMSLESANSRGVPEEVWEPLSFNECLSLAQERRRGLITEVPGEGDLRGVAQINGDVIAWRDNVGATQLDCYKANAGTWDNIPTCRLFSVNNGAATAAYGDVCNAGKDIIVGVYKHYDATGTEEPTKTTYAVKRVSGVAPTAFVRDSDSGDLGTVIDSEHFLPLPGGEVRSVNHNFKAGLTSYHMYFADGVNCSMFYNTEYDIIQPIASDIRRRTEVCKHVVAFNARLFMSTTGGTFLTSVVGEPDQIDGFLGAQEIGVGDEITGFARTSTENLAIFTRQRTFAFLGNDASNWTLRLASANSGCNDGCVAQVDDVFMSDDRGITRLSRVEALGGFDAATVTDDIQSLFQAVSKNATCATTLRRLNQMRFYYGEQFLMLSRVPYNANGNEGIRYGVTEGVYPVPVKTIHTGEGPDGFERTVFTSTGGYVYLMDQGTSFDGEEMEVIISLHYQDLNAPSVKKRWTGIEVEGLSAGDAECQVFYYMNDGTKTFEPRTISFPGAPGTFDVSSWDNAVFDSVPLVRPRMKLRGTGYNIQFSFYRKSIHEPQLTLTGYNLRYKVRGLVPL